MRRLAWIPIVMPLVVAAAATASIRGCTYRNVSHGPLPYVTRVTTNLIPAVAGRAGVCRVVSDVVRQLQLRGYDLDSGPRLSNGDRSWILHHHLVYPRGWPRPPGPVYDPHMQVTLTMTAPSREWRKPAGNEPRFGLGRRTTTYWIRLSELT